MFADFDWLNEHVINVAVRILIAFAWGVGAVVGSAYLLRRRHTKQMQAGDARDVLAIEQTIVTKDADGTVTMRIRGSGAAELEEVFSNQAAKTEFLNRSNETSETNALISMHGQQGSFILNELLKYVTGQLSHKPFTHEKWLMAPVCEPRTLSHHQSTVVLLVKEQDLLEYFSSWEDVKKIKVEHGSDGARLLTLFDLANHYRKEQEELHARRQAGRSVRYEETVYLLDLALDERVITLPTKTVNWEARYADTLVKRDLSA